ncbi:MAG: carbon-nitrogen family hydrolase [Verrucomicrobia bacterium]|nr:carbon-nitrogen family hydrolase [Verrucomicrobiota bacterium]MBI3867785.1 carbon-nitrogen family hydrolase [Verrucomicrobiota bacterium]
MNIVALQWDLAWEDRSANFATVRRLLDSAPPAPGSLVILPEMFATGFTMNVEVAREPSPSPVEAFLSEIARGHQVALLAGLASGFPGARPRNEAVFVNPEGRIVSRYAKRQPFSPSGEAALFEAGGASVVLEWAGFQVSPLVCYDLRFPELFREAVAQGAEVLVVIANWPSKRAEHWVTLLRARAIENQAYVVGVNRCGRDPGFPYPGRSIVVDPHGDIVADAGAGETALKASLDREALVQWRRDFPALRDRRASSCPS